jgi:hypothetical protein
VHIPERNVRTAEHYLLPLLFIYIQTEKISGFRSLRKSADDVSEFFYCVDVKHTMEDSLTVLPPDKEIFHEKKQTSEKQKAHLARAREAAKATIERRRQLEAIENAKMELEAKKKDIPEPIEEEEEKENIDPQPVKKTKRKETEEEAEIRRFEKFCKQMALFDQMKEQDRLEKIEASKVKLSLTQEEHDHMMYLLDKEKREQEEAAKPPPTPKKEEPIVPRSVRSYQVNSIPRTSRFGVR